MAPRSSGVTTPMPGGFGRVRWALNDRYETVRELGHGGMATLFLAKDR